MASLKRKWDPARNSFCGKARDPKLALLSDPTLKNRLQQPVAGTRLLLPTPTFVTLTDRFTCVTKHKMVPIIQTEGLIKLQNFVQAKSGLTYVHGPQGFGKSFALYHLFCELSSDPRNRVLYLPTCALLQEEPLDALCNATVAAFANDSEFLRGELYSLFLSKGRLWSSILLLIRRYCDAHTPSDGQVSPLNFYAILDQHNALPMARSGCTNVFTWTSSLEQHKVIVSASANDVDDDFFAISPCLFPYFHTLSTNELASWRTEHNFYPFEPSLQSLTEVTRNVPYELQEVLRA